MKFRWTIKELEENSDYEMLRGLVVERMSNLNPYAPLYKRLANLHKKLQIKEQLTKKTQKTPKAVRYV